MTKDIKVFSAYFFYHKSSNEYFSYCLVNQSIITKFQYRPRND